MMAGRNLWGVWGGVVLVGLGVVILLGQLLNVNIWSFIWPFFILAAGAMFFIGMVAGGRSTGALAIPGSIIVTIGLILFVQNVFNIWATWAYAWGLIISGVGVGLLIFGRWSSLPDLNQVGRVVAIIGLILFFTFGVLFELGAALFNLRSPGGLFWPVMLILAGLYILVARPLLSRSAGPVGRSEINFAAGASAAAGHTVSGGLAAEQPAINAQGGAEPQIVPAVDLSAEQVAGVRRVSFRAIGDLTIIQGDSEGLEIVANQAVRERLRVETRGDTLEIRLDDQWWSWIDPRYWNLAPIRYTLTLRDLQSLVASGLGNINAAQLSTSRLELSLSGAGNLIIRKLAVEDLLVRLSGLGNLEIFEGRADTQEITLSGAGNYEARRLESRSARVRLNGLGNATLWAAEELDAALSGAGNVEYYGSPRITQHISGLGNIRRLGS
jgi:hypothetical protein